MQGTSRLEYTEGMEKLLEPGTLVAYPFDLELTTGPHPRRIHVLARWLGRDHFVRSLKTGKAVELPLETVAEFETREEMELYLESLGTGFVDLGFEPDILEVYRSSRIVPMRRDRGP